MTDPDIQETVQAFGSELLFAVAGLEAQTIGTRAVFEIEWRGKRRIVTVESARKEPIP